MSKNKKPVKVSNPDQMTNVKTMSREGMRIIRDIAFGKFNFYENGHIFRNFNFTNAVLDEVNKRMTDVGIHIAAIKYAYSGNQDPVVLNLLQRDMKTYEAYNLIRETLSSIILSGGDTGFLLVLQNKLPQYKYNI